MDKFTSHTSWMRDIHDGAPVTTLSIPGTHNSCCFDVPLGIAETQNLDLSDQLNAGIRFLDIRLAHYQDNLFVHHDVAHMGKSYLDVLDTCASFLRQHPSETILMLVKDESRIDKTLGKFAPSAVIGKLFSGDATSSSKSTRSFEYTFKARTREHSQDGALFYNFTVDPHDDNSVTTALALTSETTLREIRGKIVLLRSFEGGQDVGLDLTYWPENQKFRSATSLIYDVEDRYKNPGREEKYNFVVTHIEEARRGDLRNLYITFSSAVSLKAAGYSKVINPRLNDYLTGSQRGRVGIIVMDYFEEPRELVSNVIRMN